MDSLRWPVVLFDLDGTLVDTIGLIITSLQHTWRTELGEELDVDLARGWIGRTLPDMFAPYGADKVERMRSTYVEFNIEQLPVLQTSIDGMVELVDDLRAAGAELAVATSKRRGAAQLSLDVSGLTGKVTLATTLDDTDVHKPRPEPLLHALDHIGRDAREAVYVGDAIYDIQAAKAAGLDQIAVTWGAGEASALEAELPTALVHEVAELRQLLLG